MPVSTSRRRRAALGAGTALVAALALVPATGARAEALRPVLPAPTGKRPVGTAALWLVDRSRHDPLVPSKPYRELMVSLWYPAERAPERPAPYLARAAAADWDARSAPQLGIAPGAVDWAGIPSHAGENVPAARRENGYPVILFASGDGGPRTLGTSLVEELASRGYVVVTVDHTYEADQVEFPGGRVERAVPLPENPTEEDIARLIRKHSRARLADLGFVLDRLTAGTPLPPGLRESLDTSRVGTFGQSLGGSVSAQLAHDDRRVDVGANLDGEYVGPVARSGVAKPFLQMASTSRTRRSDPTWRSFWNRSTGWKREVRLIGSRHGSFTDLQVLLPQIGGLPYDDLIGTIDPGRSVALQRAYVTAFFDLHLKGRPTRLFDRPTQSVR